jgi:hypothetical protein
MTTTRNLLVGFGLLIIVAVGIFVIVNWCQIFPCPKPPEPTPTPIPLPTPTPTPRPIFVYGGYRCFEDEQCLAILHDRYGIVVTGEFRKGTFAMSDDYHPEVDCIWPGSNTGIEYFRSSHPDVTIRKSEVIFQTPIALFTWKELLPQLEKAGLVYTSNDEVNLLRMKSLVEAMIAEKKWKDIGVDIPGYIRVESTDPAQSSSGMLWMEMIGSFLVSGNDTGGRVLTKNDLQTNPTILPALYTYWENQGLQVNTTSKLFDKFISSGAGIPIIVAYESSFIDWYESQSEDMKAQAGRIVGLYPEITINTDHTLASLTPACDPLVNALATDKELQELGWLHAGMRNPSGGIGRKPPSAAWFAASVPYENEAKIDVYNAIKELLQ